MPRYRRVNIDGRSMYKTETRRVSAGATAGLLPGTFVVLDGSDEWIQATAGALGRVYVMGAAEHEGLGITDAVPAQHSGVGNYVEEAREFAIRVAAGNYSKDQPIAVGANGLGVAAGANVIGYCQDDATLADTDFIRVRMRAVLTAPAVTSVTVTPETDSVAEGATVQLTAVVAPAQADQGIVWTTSSAGTATVDQTGLVTGVAAGTATITATSGSDNTKSDTATITVTG